ncbi:MAG: hypothetical protein SGJ27_24035 [Candidatus Melainabacteria bacterium]|nr:hypothetical protein [Candidatus Melainabacteria bacterium]
MTKINDNSAETTERKRSVHSASGGVIKPEDSHVISKQEKAKQETFSSNATLKTVNKNQADRHRSLQIVDGDQVLLDSHTKIKSKPSDNSLGAEKLKQGHKDSSDHVVDTKGGHDKALVNVKQVVESMRESGILTAPGRTGTGDIEYKMVIYKDGSSSKAFQNQFVGKDPATHSDVFAAHPELIKEILFKTLMGNPIAILIHSHPNKHGMEPNAFSKEDVAESNASGADSIVLAPDGRVFLHKSNPDGKLMDPANITDAMRAPDAVLGRFDSDGKFHPAKYEGKNIVFEANAF